MSEVIPSIYAVESMGHGHHGGGLPTGNVKLRFGEVKREILPSSPESYSKKYREYEVLVQHYEGGSATHRMYHHCMVLNSMCGLGDHSDKALRVSDEKDFKLGNGSRVYLLCVEGNDARAVIIGGPQQRKDTSNGVHKEEEFNGVNFQVLDDGGWVLESKGKTNNDGTMHDKADKDGAGTTVKVEANGNFVVNTQGGKCSVTVDHKAGTIIIDSNDNFVVKTSKAKIEADSLDVKASSVNLNSSTTKVGSNAVHPAVLGEQLVAVLSAAFAAISPSLLTPYQQAALGAASAQLATILSKTVTVAS